MPIEHVGFEWTVPPDIAFEQLGDQYASSVHNTVLRMAEIYRGEIKKWIQVNAPWQDRTYRARTHLYCKIQDVPLRMVVIRFGHGMWYGTRLEFEFAGKYAIIAPALDLFTVRIGAELRRLFA